MIDTSNSDEQAKRPKTYNFYKEWEEDYYLFIAKIMRSVCSATRSSVNVFKTSSTCGLEDFKVVVTCATSLTCKQQFNVGDVRERDRMKRRKREGCWSGTVLGGVGATAAWKVPQPQLWEHFSFFGSSYLCESAFSHMKIIQSKYRTTLTDDHLVTCNQLIQPRLWEASLLFSVPAFPLR